MVVDTVICELGAAGCGQRTAANAMTSQKIVSVDGRRTIYNG